jgi:mannose-6-phosphate isomerase-like protein (cupin superfamily)
MPCINAWREYSYCRSHTRLLAIVLPQRNDLLRREEHRCLPSSATATFHDVWGIAADGRQLVCRIVRMSRAHPPVWDSSAAPIGEPAPAVHPVSPLRAATLLSELWSPRVIAELDDHCVKVARLEGDFAWHAHPDEDELFYVLAGCLHIALPDRQVVLHAGELFVVPRGVRHRPSAASTCLVMLIEQRATAHAGDADTPHSRSLADQLRPIEGLHAAPPNPALAAASASAGPGAATSAAPCPTHDAATPISREGP